MEVEKGKEGQKDREAVSLRIKSLRKPLPTWTQSVGVAGRRLPSPAPPDVGVSNTLFPFLLRAEGPQTGLEGTSGSYPAGG